MHCLLEQGYLCMGPVTRAGCAGAQGEAPRCLVARVPCRGCFGPVQHDGNQLLDMLNALASNGIDCASVTDNASLLRFSGAHGLVRPAAACKYRMSLWGGLVRPSGRTAGAPRHKISNA